MDDFHALPQALACGPRRLFFQGDSFMSWCSKQHGVVERRSQTFKRTYDKLLSEAEADQAPATLSTYDRAA
eukprot:11200304-Lingulodinium_polyedra.AAC.1